MVTDNRHKNTMRITQLWRKIAKQELFAHGAPLESILPYATRNHQMAHSAIFVACVFSQILIATPQSPVYIKYLNIPSETVTNVHYLSCWQLSEG